MQVSKAALLGALLTSMALAGCSGGGDSSGFSIKGSGQTYTFTAAASADNYTWDLGDHLTKAYTKSVTHTYDFESGVVPITLVATKDAKKSEHRKSITLGSGANENAGFVLEGSLNWTVPGEAVTLSAAKSVDPEGDPLRYAWSCQRAGDAVRQSVHVHPGFGGVAFATPPAGSIIVLDAKGPLPTADRTVAGDLCESLGQGGKASLDTTITGAFTRTGIYDIYLLASDPVHPTTSGKYRIIVTTPEEKPAPRQVLPFEGVLFAGAGGAVQEGCTTLAVCDRGYDSVTHSFSLPLQAVAGSIALAYDDPTSSMGITCQLNRASTPLATVENGQNVTLNAGDLKQGSYTILCEPDVVVPTSAEGTHYVVTGTFDLDLDPFKVY